MDGNDGKGYSATVLLIREFLLSVLITVESITKLE